MSIPIMIFHENITSIPITWWREQRGVRWIWKMVNGQLFYSIPFDGTNDIHKKYEHLRSSKSWARFVSDRLHHGCTHVSFKNKIQILKGFFFVPLVHFRRHVSSIFEDHLRAMGKSVSQEIFTFSKLYAVTRKSKRRSPSINFISASRRFASIRTRILLTYAVWREPVIICSDRAELDE